jgi:hypothetical protein
MVNGQSVQETAMNDAARLSQFFPSVAGSEQFTEQNTCT